MLFTHFIQFSFSASACSHSSTGESTLRNKVSAFVSRWFFSTKHKDIGTLYFLFGALAGVCGTLLSVLIRLKLYSPPNDLLSKNQQSFNAIAITRSSIVILFLIMWKYIRSTVKKLRKLTMYTRLEQFMPQALMAGRVKARRRTTDRLLPSQVRRWIRGTTNRWTRLDRYTRQLRRTYAWLAKFPAVKARTGGWQSQLSTQLRLAAFAGLFLGLRRAVRRWFIPAIRVPPQQVLCKLRYHLSLVQLRTALNVAAGAGVAPARDEVKEKAIRAAGDKAYNTELQAQRWQFIVEAPARMGAKRQTALPPNEPQLSRALKDSSGVPYNAHHHVISESRQFLDNEAPAKAAATIARNVAENAERARQYSPANARSDTWFSTLESWKVAAEANPDKAAAIILITAIVVGVSVYCLVSWLRAPTGGAARCTDPNSDRPSDSPFSGGKADASFEPEQFAAFLPDGNLSALQYAALFFLILSAIAVRCFGPVAKRSCRLLSSAFFIYVPGGPSRILLEDVRAVSVYVAELLPDLLSSAPHLCIFLYDGIFGSVAICLGVWYYLRWLLCRILLLGVMLFVLLDWAVVVIVVRPVAKEVFDLIAWFKDICFELTTWFRGVCFDLNYFDALLEQDTVANLRYGVLFLLALSSLGVYSIILAGWSSNSKYAFIGALRSAAQMISYEVAISLIILPVIVMSGSLNLTMIVHMQQVTTWFVWPLLPVAFVFLIAMLAETNRTPFDLPEAEAELVAGYNVDYSSLPFAMFFLGEYCNMILISLVFCLLFLSGGLNAISLSASLVLALKGAIIWIFFVIVRATLPRYRYDQLMDIGWKIFLPISGGFLLFVFGVLVYADGLIVTGELPLTPKLPYSLTSAVSVKSEQSLDASPSPTVSVIPRQCGQFRF